MQSSNSLVRAYASSDNSGDPIVFSLLLKSTTDEVLKYCPSEIRIVSNDSVITGVTFIVNEERIDGLPTCVRIGNDYTYVTAIFGRRWLPNGGVIDVSLGALYSQNDSVVCELGNVTVDLSDSRGYGY